MLFRSVGPEVCRSILEFLNNGSEFPNVNHTRIVLIPKVAEPRYVRDYRPISLCNIIYKMITKTVANRLKKHLTGIIVENQSAFVPGRLIFDNVMVAYETIHHMKNKRVGGTYQMALKLDMSKAYDRVEWGYLERIMINLGFPSRWIRLVMTCVRTVTYSVVVNGSPCGHIVPTRGLRQGDPLSPYLFLLCMEGFSALIKKAKNQGVIHGVSVTRAAPKVSHLLFADDSIVFI